MSTLTLNMALVSIILTAAHIPARLSDPWGRKYILFGLNGNEIGAQKPKKENTYAAEQVRICFVLGVCRVLISLIYTSDSTALYTLAIDPIITPSLHHFLVPSSVCFLAHLKGVCLLQAP